MEKFIDMPVEELSRILRKHILAKKIGFLEVAKEIDIVYKSLMRVIRDQPVQVQTIAKVYEYLKNNGALDTVTLDK